MGARPTAPAPLALAAPDKFKGTLSAADVASALADGVRQAGWRAIELPIADGGEGTAAALLAARGGRWESATVVDALGRPVEARFALLDDGDAVVEVAQASGLWRLDEDDLDPWAASSTGTGQLIEAGIRAGARRVIVAAGGSATTDGGAGALAALDGQARRVPLLVACDTAVTFEEAAVVYGPQKGADEPTVRRLTSRLHELAGRAPRDPRGEPMTGAAGGLAGGLWAFAGAELVAGARLVLDALDVDARLAEVDIVLTGEGRIDAQTMTGKAVGELAARCVRAGVPCHAIVGRNDLRTDDHARMGLAAVREAGTLSDITAVARSVVSGGPVPA
jgi:glycerate kinase